ncbi:hypothetical protein EC973_000696 [Apophysomyces ossiformis]|uniref:Letm1 RBD domain-containing protein n=1 Tax=Apophysomyces ossiformis TaxID=679940 RepID=A0A8H7C0D0_9FUNG|nr:hypothetical protein EC973_000696 [Apophysomyces ossiformis]
MSSSILLRRAIHASGRVVPLTAKYPLQPRYASFPSVAPRAFSSSAIRWTEAQSPKQQAHIKAAQSAAVEATSEPTSRIGKFIKQSKELLAFYKGGVKLLWANHKTVKQLKQKVEKEGYTLSRSEFQLVHESGKDMLKLIPFGIVLLVLPESIPLLVIFVPGVVPSTCVKESQVVRKKYIHGSTVAQWTDVIPQLKQREKLDKARQIMSKNVIQSAEKIGAISPEDFLSVRKFEKVAKGYEYDFDLQRIDRNHLSAYCRFMGLAGWGTHNILKRRLNKHMDYLLEDDKLLAQEGVEKLPLSELQKAVEERGMRSLGADEQHLRRSLKYWLAVHLSEPSIPRGLLVFSRMFLLNANYTR